MNASNDLFSAKECSIQVKMTSWCCKWMRVQQHNHRHRVCKQYEIHMKIRRNDDDDGGDGFILPFVRVIIMIFTLALHLMKMECLMDYDGGCAKWLSMCESPTFSALSALLSVHEWWIDSQQVNRNNSTRCKTLEWGRTKPSEFLPHNSQAKLIRTRKK